ncbi:hypothetical protein GCM10007094_23580 [Pseudovibrio japonicus]|uniref:Transposase n=1 Tax=Pseudovibrio japonicus TaxID=366534 RepID=A0ABQ3EGG9_9HYPH|nr:hypothetical protein GCM10007094_23580 [Pseudovibrio japonicus]
MPVDNAKVKVDATFYWMGDRVHIRGFIDDHVCYRVWRRRKKRWDYHVHPLYLFCRFAEPNLAAWKEQCA